MTNRSLLVALFVSALALIATAATVVYAGSMMSRQSNASSYEMSEEQCESVMESMHNSEQHGSMMGNSNHDGTMNSNNMGGMSNMSGIGTGGCH